MYSRDQRPYLFNETKGSFCITKEFSPLRNDLRRQHDRFFIVWEHLHCGCDVMRIRSKPPVATVGAMKHSVINYFSLSLFQTLLEGNAVYSVGQMH